jgi:MFS family permease
MHHSAMTKNVVLELTLAHTLRMTGISMAGLILPLYLGTSGYSLREIILYFLVMAATWVLALRPAARFNAYYGPIASMAASLPLTIIWVLCIAFIDPASQWFLPTAVLWGIFIAQYWQGMRVAFATSLPPKQAGRDIAIVSGIVLASSAAAPFVGGVIAQEAGIVVLYVASGAIIALASGALWMLRGRWKRKEFHPETVPPQTIRRYLIANGSSEIEADISGWFWTLFIFIYVPTYAGVGALSSVIITSSIVVSLYVGWREEQRGAKHYLREGSILMTGVNIVRIGAQGASGVAGINILAGLGHALTETPYVTEYYRHVRERPSVEYVYWMNFAASSACVLLLLVLLALTYFFDDKTVLLLALLIGGPASFAVRYIR